MRITASWLAAAAFAVPAASSLAQINGPRNNQFPDVIVSSVGGSYDTTATGIYGVNNGIAAYSMGSDSCNIGTHAAIWITGSSQNTWGAQTNQHPVIGQQVYRFYQGRFEQIGMSWLKHGFCAADACSSGASSGGLQGCGNIAGFATGQTNCVRDLGNLTTGTTCDWLGYGRSTDTYGQSLNATQGYLGPRSEVNAWSGVYPYPYVLNGSNAASCLNKRLLIRTADLDATAYPRFNATTNPTGAQFFAEIVYVMTDEWPNQRFNNYSYRKLNVAATTSNTSVTNCSGAYYGLSFSTGTGNITVAMKPAIEAWKAADPSVTLLTADAPNDGRFYIGGKATDLGNGSWQYEYAVFNMNSHRGCAGFVIPKANSSAVEVTSLGFSAPAYHSGEPYSQTPWTGAVGDTSISWATTPYATSQNANAIRWSTLYNFRFVANQPPKTTAPVRLNLFKPGVQPTDADFIEVTGVPVPGDPPCRADFDHDTEVTVGDVFVFVNSWFEGLPAADFNGVNGLTTDDVFDFVNAWFVGCP